MASTVFELTVTLAIAIATLPVWADEFPCNAVTTCRFGKAKWIVNTTVAPSAHHGSTEAADAKYAVEVRNHIAVKRLSDVMETVTSVCSFEETAAEDLGALLDAGAGALVTLVAGEERLTAHRAVLAARSPAFATMLCHGSQGASSDQVRVPDVEGPVLRQILAYLYTLQAPQLPGMAPQLLAAAERFGLSDLKSHSEAQVAAQLDVETAAAIAVLAIKHSSTSLRQAAIAFIRANLVQVLATRGWSDAVRYQPDIVIEVYQLLAELPVETSPQNASLLSTPAAADSQPTTEAQSSQGQTPATSADGQPTTEAQSSQSQTPATTASPAPHCPIAPPGDDAVCCLRRLSSEEKGRKLIEAAMAGIVGEVESLLAAGADLEARDWKMDTALHHAAWEGHVEVARRLVGCGAEVDARDWGQYTPLHLVAWKGHTALAPLLLEAGADKGARDKDGKTPLDLARSYNKQQVIALLI